MKFPAKLNTPSSFRKDLYMNGCLSSLLVRFEGCTKTLTLQGYVQTSDKSDDYDIYRKLKSNQQKYVYILRKEFRPSHVSPSLLTRGFIHPLQFLSVLGWSLDISSTIFSPASPFQPIYNIS